MFAEQPEPQTPEVARALADQAAASPNTARGPELGARDFDVNLLALGAVKGIGHRTLRRLVDYFGDLNRIWDEDTPIVRDLLAEGQVRDPERLAGLITSRSGELRDQGARQRDALARKGTRVFSMHDAEFPKRLRTIPDSPYWILVQGDSSILHAPPLVAIVGTREASLVGRKTAERLAWLVVDEGLGVVSGLAEGIDAAAHRAVAARGVPQVAILGTGIDVEFPAATVPLRREIVQQGGAIVSEYLPGDTYYRARFVERNRIQAALAHAICPVEGRLKSGTAHTVQFAKRYKRTVFGVEYGSRAPGNEMPGYLVAEGDQVVQLNTDEGIEQLKTVLGKIPGRRRPPPTMPPPGSFWRPVLDAVNEVQALRTASPAYRQWSISCQHSSVSVRRATILIEPFSCGRSIACELQGSRAVSVKGVVLDLDGTLLLPDGSAPPGVGAMIDELRASGISIAVASGRPGVSAAAVKLRLAGAELRVDEILTRDSVGSNKGTKNWVGNACQAFALAPNELVWLGDSDLDMRCAVNGRVVYFNAGWSNPSYPYGIAVDRPHIFSLVVTECFAKQAYWFWQLDTSDRGGRAVQDRALIDGGGANLPALKNGLISFLKLGTDPHVGPLKVRDFIMMHMLGSIYGEGLHLRADTWTVYPGSSGGPNKEMDFVVNHVVKQFRDRYVGDLLVRHTQAVDSGETRSAGGQVSFANQINSIHVNPAQRKRVKRKTILVVDDFETQAWSAECARNLLLRAGAREVICVSLGKYGNTRHVVSDKQQSWDPFVAQTHPAGRFTDGIAQGPSDKAVLTAIRDSYQRVSARK